MLLKSKIWWYSQPSFVTFTFSTQHLKLLLCTIRQLIQACIIYDYKLYTRDDKRSGCLLYTTSRYVGWMFKSTQIATIKRGKSGFSLYVLSALCYQNTVKTEKLSTPSCHLCLFELSWKNREATCLLHSTPPPSQFFLFASWKDSTVQIDAVTAVDTASQLWKPLIEFFLAMLLFHPLHSFICKIKISLMFWHMRWKIPQRLLIISDSKATIKDQITNNFLPAGDTTVLLPESDTSLYLMVAKWRDWPPFTWWMW